MNFLNLQAIIRAETKITVGLFRYWVFLISAWGIAISLYLGNAVRHAVLSSVSISAPYLSPHNVLTQVSVPYMAIFIFGVIFLVVEIRARDSRARMLDLLDTRPYSNMELLTGRFLALFLCSWIPILVLLVLIQSLGWLLLQSGSPVGGTVAPLSMLGFAVYMAIPAIAFFCSLVMLISLLVRYRIIAFALCTGILFGSIYLLTNLPHETGFMFDLLGLINNNIEPSDWVVSLGSPAFWLQRLSIFFFAMGLLVFATLIHPRLDGGNRHKNLAIATIFMTVGLAMMGLVYSQLKILYESPEIWRIAHEEKSEQPVPDIVSMRADVDIIPGDEVFIDMEITIKTTSGIPLETTLFSLNPGFVVNQVTDNNNEPLKFKHDDGLIEITLNKPLNPDHQATIKLNYKGTPNVMFAYLDSATTEARDFNYPGIFNKDYVALMPGIYWLLNSGVDVGRDDTRERTRDFYNIQLHVRLPSGWTAAGPGLREEIYSSSEEIEFEFSPVPAVSEVALLAAPFKSYSTKIEGIVFELLLHPEHTDIINVMAHAKEEIDKWIAVKIQMLRKDGLEYPFRSFSLVEVPNTLRDHQGGWRMDTALAPPSMVLMKEKGLPTARFDIDKESTIYDWAMPDNTKYDVDDPAIASRNRLINYFSNDFGAGNLFSGFARSFFMHQTSATGSEAIALNYTLNDLATLLISGERSYFSYEKTLTSLRNQVNMIIGNPYHPHKTNTDKVIDIYTSDERVWQTIKEQSLTEIDPAKDNELTVDVLALKAGKLAELIIDTMGPGEAGRMLAELLVNHRGASFTLSDVLDLNSIATSQLAPFIDDWFNDTEIAGFIADDIRLYQLSADINGSNRYQLLMRLRNDQPVAGYTRIAWSTEFDSALGIDANRVLSKPLRIEGNSAVEFGIVLNKPPLRLYLYPYISLNRGEFLVHSFNNTNLDKIDLAPFNGVRRISEGEATDTEDSRIIVDDLDPGFSVLSDSIGLKFRIWPNSSSQDNSSEEESEQRLALIPQERIYTPGKWSRRIVDSAWGKYRHTTAFIKSGGGNRKAVFSSDLPSSGLWQLELHMPTLSAILKRMTANWQLTIVNGNKQEVIEFNAHAANGGWNLVDQFELAEGEVRVEFSNKTNGVFVFADAIAWSAIN